jgi:LuxR family transcriptional regulator
VTGEAEIEAIFDRLKALCPSGFAVALHIRFTTPAYFLQTYSKDWLARYAEKGMLMNDPIAVWGFANTGSIRWSELALSDSSGVLQEAKSFGMNFGLAHATDADNSRSVSGFSRPDREFTDQEILEIADLIGRLHRLSASQTPLSHEARERLHKLSVSYPAP